jgi:hypothetical protein
VVDQAARGGDHDLHTVSAHGKESKKEIVRYMSSPVE